jgi:hypothetical protein
MSEHTPGRLVVRGGYSIYTADDKTPVADTCLTNSVPDNDEANARRLAAAWNACEGLPTDDLEACPDGGLFHLADHANQLAIERDRLSAINAELLEALSFYADKTRYHGPNQSLREPDAWSGKVGLTAYRLDVTRDQGCIAFAAIAKAQGEQP